MDSSLVSFNLKGARREDTFRAAAFILGIVHLAWTLPDFVNFAKGSAGHPPLAFMILSLVPIAGLFYVSQNGEIKSY
jgi:hypothetical protein